MDAQVAYALLQTDPAHAADLLSGDLDASQLEPQSLWDLAEGVRTPLIPSVALSPIPQGGVWLVLWMLPCSLLVQRT